MKPENQLIFEGEKSCRKTSYKIFTNGEIEIEGPITSPGLHLSTRLHKWFKLPIKGNQHIECFGDLKFKNSFSDEINIHNTKLTIYNNNYGVYIIPNNTEIKSYFKKKSIVKCTFNLNTEHFSDYYLKICDLMDYEIRNIDKENSILSGGDKKTIFEICKVDNQIFIKHKGIMDPYGRFLLSSELRRYFKNWFKEEIFIVYINNKKLIVNSKVMERISSSKITKALMFQHYGQAKELAIIVTNPFLELNCSTQRNLKLKEILCNSGFNIEKLDSNYRVEEEHKNILFERRVKNFFKKSFKENNESYILDEARIKPIKKNQDEFFQEYFCVDILISYFDGLCKERILLLIEIKTGETKDKKIIGTEYDIARLFYLKEKLASRNIIPIVIFDGDIKDKSKITTKEFGLFTQTILIGLEEFQEMEKSPSLLKKRISEFNEKIHYKKENNFYQNPNIELLRNKKSNHQGSYFENQTKSILRKEYSDIDSNVYVKCFGKKFEIDHLVSKNGKYEIVSCKDRKNWKSSSLDEEIKKYLIRLYFRKKIFGIEKGILYVKTRENILIKRV